MRTTQHYFLVGLWTLLCGCLVLWQFQLRELVAIHVATTGWHAGAESFASLAVWSLGVAGIWLTHRRALLHERDREGSAAALAAGEERWRSALSAVGDGVWDWNAQTGAVYFSSRWKSMLGFAEHEIRDRLEEWESRVHPEDYGRVMAEVRRHLAGETPLYECEHRVRCKDGGYKWIRDRGQVVTRAGDGTPLRMVGTHQDLTAQKQAESAQQESEGRYRRLLASVTDYVFSSELEEGRPAVVTHSPGCVTVTGYTAGEFAASPQLWFEIVLPAQRAEVQQHWAVTLRGETVAPLEHMIRHKDGTTRWVRGTVVLRRDSRGRACGVDGLVQDITLRKLAEEALRQSHAMLAKLAAQVPGVIYQYRLGVDGSSCFPFASAGINDIYEVTPEEVRTDATPAFGRLHPDDLARVGAEIHESARTLQPFHCEFRVALPRQGVRWRLCDAMPERTEDGGTLWHGIISDITARKQAEESLRESEERYRTLVELSPESVVVHADGRVIFANAAAARMAGADTPAELRGLQIRNFIHPDSRELVERRLHELVAVGQSLPMIPQKWLRLDGRTVEMAVVSTRVSFGGAPATLVIAMDVTAQRQAETELRKLSRAVEQSPVTVVITDATGAIEYVNPSFTVTTGYTLEEARGLNLRVLRSGALSMDVYREMWRTISSGREWRGEFHNRKKNGELFWEAATISPIADENGRITHYLAVKEDITERRLADARIREQAALLDVTQDAILVLDLEHRVTFWNRGAEKLYGISREQAVGRSYEGIVYRELPADLDAAWHELLAKGESAGERRHVSAGQKELDVRLRATVVHDECGQATAVLLVITDITEAKRIEAQFLRAQRLESLGSLASGVAHDLNNVLTPILMAAGMLAEEAKTSGDRELIQLLSDSARRGADIVQQLLLFGRGSESARAPVNVAAVLKDMAQMVRGTFPKNIVFSQQVPKDLWMIEGDRTQIHQVVLNLCVNARDAMPDGGKLSLLAENLHVDAEFAARQEHAAPGRYLALRVADTGGGMTSGVIEKIFDPFFTTKPVGQGTGLGLATVLGIVRSHGGFITVESQEGLGATFTVYLPARVSAVEEVAVERAQATLQGHAELVLVIEDEASIRAALQRTFVASGYEVLLAGDGVEGIAVFVQNIQRIALVITDMMMPVMDGAQAVRALRRLRPELPIVAMSGVPAHRVELESNFAPPLRFLPKPFLVQKMLATVRELIDEAHVRRAAQESPRRPE